MWNLFSQKEKPFYYKTANGTEEGYIVDLIKLLNQSNVFRRPYIIHTQKNKTYSDMIRKLVADVSTGNYKYLQFAF